GGGRSGQAWGCDAAGERPHRRSAQAASSVREHGGGQSPSRCRARRRCRGRPVGSFRRAAGAATRRRKLRGVGGKRPEQRNAAVCDRRKSCAVRTPPKALFLFFDLFFPALGFTLTR